MDRSAGCVFSLLKERHKIYEAGARRGKREFAEYLRQIMLERSYLEEGYKARKNYMAEVRNKQVSTTWWRRERN